MSINQRVKYVRTQLTKTQEQFSEFIGITRDALAKIETGKQNITIDVLLNMHNKCGINLNWLICGSGKIKLTESVQTNIVNEPETDYGLKAAFEAQKELLKYKDEEITRLKECCKIQEVKDKSKPEVLKTHSNGNITFLAINAFMLFSHKK